MASNQITLAALCEPLFQYVCRLNRSARKNAVVAENQVRSDIRALLGEIRATAATHPGMSDQFDRIELVLLFFVDSTIKESRLPFASAWENLAYERNELAGEEKFFELLDDTLADPSEAATERLEVFFLCTGLGFTGWYMGQPEYLRRKMMEVSARIRQRMVSDELARVCPESYEHLNTANLIEPPGGSLAGIAIGLIGMVLVVFIAIGYIYVDRTREYKAQLNSIIQAETGAAGDAGDSEGGA